MAILFTILGAIWRVLDGSDKRPPFSSLYPLLLSAVVAVFDWQLGVAMLIGSIALLDGFKDWTDFGYMSMRYTGYAALACALVGVSNWFILAALLAGLTYPTFNWIASKKDIFPKWWHFTGYTTYCEFICGAVMLGAPAFLI